MSTAATRTTTICAVDLCSNTVRGMVGLCSKHYQRQWRFGDVDRGRVRKTHCKYGHAYEDNSYTTKEGWRICKECNKRRRPKYVGTESARACRRVSSKKYRDKDRPSYNLKMRLKNYGITEEQFQALLIAQDYHCRFCSESDDLHIDHCHRTGRVRGLLCRKHNLAIGMFDEDINAMKKAIEYLEQVPCQ